MILEIPIATKARQHALDLHPKEKADGLGHEINYSSLFG